MYFRSAMKYRKLSADKIFDGYMFREASVLVVTEGGIIENIIPVDEAGEEVESFAGILSPGFINCHCHLELSHMKGRIPEKTSLVDFVFKVVTERHHSEDEILKAIEDAEEQMFRNGIVAVGDICNNAFTLIQKQKARLQYYNFVEASGWLPSMSQGRFDRAKEIFNLYAISDSRPPAPDAERLARHCSIVPHAPYSVSENLWQQIQPYFKNKVVSIHNQETRSEDEFFLEGTGDFKRMYRLMNIDNSHHQPTKKTSLQSYFGKLEGAANVILVHNTYTKQEDVTYVKQTKGGNGQLGEGPFFCLCINANLYIENALPPIELLRKNSCSIVLGTDSLASNWSLSIADELKTIRSHYPEIPITEMLRWATSNGAKALQMDDRLGSFEKGKRPGVILMDESTIAARRIA